MGERLDTRLRELSPAAFHGLITTVSEIDQFRGWWKGSNLPSPRHLEHLRKRVTRISARASTRMAESGFPEPGLAEAQRERKAARGAYPASLETTGYAELLDTTFERHRELVFGQDLILRFHAMLLRHSPKDRGHRGRYRTGYQEATAYPGRRLEALSLRPTSPHMIPGELRAAIEWTASRLASGEFHPLFVIAGFILEFLSIRPFADGNARLSRILTNCLLLQCGHAYVPYASLEEVIADRYTEYYLALRRSQMNRNVSRPDISAWLYAFLEALRAQIGMLRLVLETQSDHGLLSRNQVGVLGMLERNEEVSNRQVCRELGIPKDTAKQVLNRLLSLNMLQRVGRGRAVRYRKVPLSGE